MKNLSIIFLILLFAFPCYGAEKQVARMSTTMAGGGVAAVASDPCATGTATIIAQDTNDSGNSRDFNTYTIGQSFAGTANPFYSFSIYKSGAASGTVTCRIGTTTNLSSTYTDSVSITVGTEEAWYEGISSTCPNLTTGTWYAICSIAADADITWVIEEGNDYANGTYYYGGTAHAFSVSDAVAGRDTNFKVKVRQ